MTDDEQPRKEIPDGLVEAIAEAITSGNFVAVPMPRPAALAAATDDEAHKTTDLTGMKYAEDLKPGDVVHWHHDRDAPSMKDLCRGDGDGCGMEWVTITEIREYGPTLSALGMREDGEMVPAYYSHPEIVRVRLTAPGDEP